MSVEKKDENEWDLSAEEVAELIEREKESENFIILDVRTSFERFKQRIPHTVHLDFYKKNFWEKIDKLDRNKTYLVHCAVGGRSGKAVEKMREEMGFEKAFNFLGQLRELKEKGIETTWGWGE